MLRLALHWQILIGMIVGTVVGVTLNIAGSGTSVVLRDGLPPGIESVSMTDTASRSEITITGNDGQQVTRAIDPLGKNGDFRTLDDLRQADPIAATLYVQHGQSSAKRVGAWFKRIGGLFLRMLQMVAVPLIITSLLTGVLGLGLGDGVGRMFRNTILYYLATSFLAIVTGLIAVNLIRPGLSDIDVKPTGIAKITEAKPLGEVLFDQLEAMIPANPLAALTEPNFLSIIAFTIAFGLFTLAVGGETLERVKGAATAGFEVMMAMTAAIIRLAPIGVLFLIASVTATQGPDIFVTLGWYVIAVALALGRSRDDHVATDIEVCRQAESGSVRQGYVARAVDGVQQR